MVDVLLRTAQNDFSKFKECIYDHDTLKYLASWLKNARNKMIQNKEGIPYKTPEAEVVTCILDLLLQKCRVETESQVQKIKKSRLAYRILSLSSSRKDKASTGNREYPKSAISSTITVPAFSNSYIFLS